MKQILKLNVLHTLIYLRIVNQKKFWIPGEIVSSVWKYFYYFSSKVNELIDHQMVPVVTVAHGDWQCQAAFLNELRDKFVTNMVNS